MSDRIKFPLGLMLTAGAVTSVIAYIRDFSLIHFLWVLVASLFIFFLIGNYAVRVIERFQQENEDAEELANAEAEDGAVIEKDPAFEEQDMPFEE